MIDGSQVLGHSATLLQASCGSQRPGFSTRRITNQRRPAMARIIVMNHVTLGGVMQGPGRPDEDTRGGFTRGGWGQSGGYSQKTCTCSCG